METGPGKLAYGQAEAAKALSVSVRTIRTLTRKGELRCRMVGRKPLYSVSALVAFLDGDERVPVKVEA